VRFPAVLASLTLLAACDNRPDQWDAFVYPDKGDLSEFHKIAGFKSFELCQQGAIDILRATNAAAAGDYECGYKCAPDASMGGLNVCKGTRK
jgi:hypothetical protein